jgi:condensin complex subunit 1
MTEEEKAEAMQKAAEQAATSELLTRLQLTRKYYNEAIRFIEVLHSASAIVSQLLSSRNKSEVIEAMDFFVMLDAYKVETARSGIRRMLRLIWTKGNSDEGKGVQTHLIDCYKGLFFDAPDSFSSNDAANYIARNMISLTFGATPAELTCLEQLLSTMMKAGHVSEAVIAKLWQVYSVQRKEISKTQRRGSIIVLGMLALADPDVVVKEIEAMLRIGLGGLGRSDLVLAKYTCIALRRMVPGRQAKSKDVVTVPKLANDHSVLIKLAAILEIVSESKEWYGVAEQAISAIYALSKHPDVLCSDILRRKTRFVFQPHLERPSSSHTTASGEEQRPGTASSEEQNAKPKPSSAALSQLLYVVGHIAIKQIVHLELCELDFKRRKAEQEKTKTAEATASKEGEAAEADELDLIGGTTEDDFQDAMAHIRERELLYGENSLLAKFGPLVAEICANNNSYPDRDLQASATLCMAKLMCVSAEYCEKNLPLLITIMERSEDPIVRSNAVIALGDMAVCFNHLIDENTDFLYRRLNDDEASVKRTCLMTLTFLILAGQVKVKGQLGEMAKCLEDDDKKIADLARMFFTELATKDNAVYNHFVDMFSLLSAERSLEEASLRRIVKFLIGFVEKVSHSISFPFSRNLSFSHYFTRKNTPVNSPTSWLLVSLVARPSASGTMSPTRCPCSRIRTRRSPRSSPLDSTRWLAGQLRLLPARRPAHLPVRRRSARQHSLFAVPVRVDDILMSLMTVISVYIPLLDTWLRVLVAGWLVHYRHSWSFESYMNLPIHLHLDDFLTWYIVTF